MPSIISYITRRIKPSCAVWEITLRCNSNCIHCGSDAGKTRSDELDTEEALKLVKDLHSYGYKGVALMGGEPLVRDDWFEIAKEIKRLKMDLSIVTNGLLVKHYIQQIKESNADCVSLSLDGATAKTHDYLRGVDGAFDKTLEAINLLKKEKLPVSVITTVSKINFYEINEIKNLIIDRNIAWQIQLAVPIGRFQRDLVISREQFYTLALFISINAKKYSYKRLPIIGAHCFGYYSNFMPNLGLDPWVGCQAGLSVLGIQSNGNIKGCLTLSDNLIEGNVRTQSLKSILSDPLAFRYNRGFQRNNLKGYCLTCEVNKECRGGCIGTSRALKSYEDPYCLRAIEDSLSTPNNMPFRGKLNIQLSKYKNLYKKILTKRNII